MHTLLVSLCQVALRTVDIEHAFGAEELAFRQRFSATAIEATDTFPFCGRLLIEGIVAGRMAGWEVQLCWQAS